MKNNAIINTTLKELFNVMDPKAYVIIFKDLEGDKDELLRSTSLFRLLADDKFIGKYGSYKIIGLTIVLDSISLLIKEA